MIIKMKVNFLNMNRYKQPGEYQIFDLRHQDVFVSF